MKIRWFAAGIAAVLITGGAATVAQRVITQKTRGVLPEKNDSAHADSRTPQVAPPPLLAVASPSASPPIPQLAGSSQPTEPALLPAIEPPPAGPQAVEVAAEPAPPALPVEPTMAVVSETTQPVASPPPDPTAAAAPVPATDPAVNLATDRGAPASAADQSSVHVDPAKGDPLETVETFVERNRKEAEAAIQALSTESENLKARLAKVEAALVRWQTFSRALSTDQPAAQSAATPPPKANWKRAEPEPTARPSDPVPAVNSPSTVQEAPPVASSPELPAPSTVTVPSEDPAAPSTESKPPELPPTPAPENPPDPKN